MTGFVYFIQAIDGGPIKIGRAANVGRRLRMLQIGNPAILQVLAFAPGGSSEETAVHRALAKHRHRNEWFSASDAVIEMVNFVRAHGKFPVEGSAGRMKPRPLSLTSQKLLDEIEEFLALPEVRLSRETQSSFGIAVMNDARFIPCLRAGRRVWADTAEKVRGYISNKKRQLNLSSQEAA